MEYVLMHRIKKTRYKLIHQKISFEALYRAQTVPLMLIPNSLMVPAAQLVWNWGPLKDIVTEGRFHLTKSEVLTGPDKGQRILDPIVGVDKHTSSCDIILPANHYLKQDLECLIEHRDPQNLKQIAKINTDALKIMHQYNVDKMKEYHKTFNDLHKQFLKDD